MAKCSLTPSEPSDELLDIERKITEMLRAERYIDIIRALPAYTFMVMREYGRGDVRFLTAFRDTLCIGVGMEAALLNGDDVLADAPVQARKVVSDVESLKHAKRRGAKFSGAAESRWQ